MVMITDIKICNDDAGVSIKKKGGILPIQKVQSCYMKITVSLQVLDRLRSHACYIGIPGL